MNEKKYIENNAQLMSEWDWEKNDNTVIERLTEGSNKLVWWVCSKGHSYQKTIHKKTSRSSSCPVCSGHLTVSGVNDFATCYPSIAEEWHPSKNGDLLPSMFSKKNGKKVWWKCKYGHEWIASIHDRADGTGCPFCSKRRTTSYPEQAIFYYVKKLYPDATSRYKDLFNNGMELDIYIPSIRVAIEFDGANWHNAEDALVREIEKYRKCKENEITLIRVKEKLEGVTGFESSDVTYFIKKKAYKKELPLVIQGILDSIDPASNVMTRKKPRQLHSTITVDLERDRNEIKRYLSVIPNSLAELRPDLVAEWNDEKNKNLLPTMFGINSNDRVWWKCSTCGHEWETTIIHRGGKRNSGCPECSKTNRGKIFTKKCVEERGSLAENNPFLAKQWHPNKNGDVTPNNITERTGKKMWWLCEKCGHEWEASPLNRSAKGVGCPACSGRVPRKGKNDLKTLYPALVAEWSFDKNELPPESCLPKSGKEVWWKCSSCGYEWQAKISSRTDGTGCPICKKNIRRSQP